MMLHFLGWGGLLLKKAPDFQHRNYEKFVLGRLIEDECRYRFWFKKGDTNALLLATDIITYDRHVVSSTEAFCLLRQRFSFPVCLCDLIPEFDRPVPTISIANHMVEHLDEGFGHLLTSLDQAWLFQDNLENMAAAVAKRDAGFDN